jgi:hypothetical protein
MSTNTVNYNSLSISDIRNLAKSRGIAAERTWTKDDFVAALTQQTSNATHDRNFVNIGKGDLKPGYVRCKLNASQGEGGREALHTVFNTEHWVIPRNMRVDLPAYLYDHLCSIEATEYRYDANDKSTDDEINADVLDYAPKYTFQVYERNDAEVLKTAWEIQRDNKLRYHYAYVKAYDEWPRDVEDFRNFKRMLRQKELDSATAAIAA